MSFCMASIETEIFWLHLLFCTVYNTNPKLYCMFLCEDWLKMYTFGVLFWVYKKNNIVNILPNICFCVRQKKATVLGMTRGWDLTDFGRVVVWSWCLHWTGHRVWEWRTQDSCWLVLHCQANQLMSAWSISLSSSQQRLTLPVQNQPNLMGMIHRGWRTKFTFGKMWECVWEICQFYKVW